MARSLGSQGLSLDLNLLICCEKFASLWLVAWIDALDFLRPLLFYLQMGMGKHIPWGAARIHTSCLSGTLESLMRIWFKVYSRPVFSQRPAWGLSQPWQAQGQTLLPQSGLSLWDISP